MDHLKEMSFQTSKTDALLGVVDISTGLDVESNNEAKPKHDPRSHRLALTAFGELSRQIRESPNNPGYLNSTTYLSYDNWLTENYTKIIEQLETDFSNLDFNWVQHDKMQLLNLDRHPNRKNPVDIAGYANNGIKTILDELNDVKYDPDCSSVRFDQLSVRALSAIIVRKHYLEELAKREPAIREILGEKPFANMLRQNALSIIQRAGLKNRSKQPHAGEPLANNHL